MKLLKGLAFIAILQLFFACAKEKQEQKQEQEQEQEISINQKFYAELKKQVHSDFFSPLKFADQNTIANKATFQLKDEIVNISNSEGKTEVNLATITVDYTNKNYTSTSKYKITVYNKDGSQEIINSIVNPEKKEGAVHFSTKNKNINIVLEPYEDYLKWSVQPINKTLVDSILIHVKTKGPFYGGGERYISSCLNGRTISNQPNDHYWDPPWHETATWANKHEPGHYKKYEPTYMQIPIAISPSGQAWYVDDASSVFMTFAEKGDEFNIRVDNHRTEFYTIQKNTPKDALQTYTAMVGRQPELPDWAVGVWVNLLDGVDSVYAKANRLKKWKIPATAIWIFDMYDIESSQGYQHWTTGTYPDLREVTDSLHKLDFKVLSYLHPYQEIKMPKTEIDNPMYQKLDSLGLLLKTPESIKNGKYKYNTDGLYNFHKPEMADIWADMLQKIIVRDNFDGYMEDFGDLSYAFEKETVTWKAIDYGLDIPLSANQHNNTYPLLYHKLSYLHADKLNKNLTTFCRSGSAGTAAYTKILWGGDQMATWNKTFGYPSVITSGISCGLSGYANWTPDILCDTPSIELWKRWVQFAAFTPIMRDHLWVNKPTSIDIWFNNETHKYFKRYADIHMTLVPYIQESLAEYRQTGTPMIRHMMLEFPEDAEAFTCEYQYMFGPKYLVAPIVEKGDVTKKIYFPKGQWKNYWKSDDIINSKGEWITVDAPIDVVPVYERIRS